MPESSYHTTFEEHIEDPHFYDHYGQEYDLQDCPWDLKELEEFYECAKLENFISAEPQTMQNLVDTKNRPSVFRADHTRSPRRSASLQHRFQVGFVVVPGVQVNLT